MTPQPLRRFRQRVLATTGSVGLFGAALLATFLPAPAAVGLLLGVAGSAFLFHLRAAEAARLLALTPSLAERRARYASLARSACRFALLAVACVRPEVSLPWAVGGLFAVPVALLVHRVGAGPAS